MRRTMLRHRWNLTPRQAVALQRRLAPRVLQVPLAGPVKTIAGTDCAFANGGKAIIAAAVLCDAQTLAVLRQESVVLPCTFPYVPGLLSFREAPAVIAAVRRLAHRPDLLLCDGQGIAHPRRLGLAAHVGLYLDLPTIGVAKSRLCGEHGRLALRRGGTADLIDHGEIVGRLLRTRDHVKPLYISVGHRITLPECVAWTLRCAPRYRLAEPNRQAHLLVSRLMRACPA